MQADGASDDFLAEDPSLELDDFQQDGDSSDGDFIPDDPGDDDANDESNIYVELQLRPDGVIAPKDTTVCSQVDSYIHRPASLEDVSVFKFTSLYYKGKGQKGKSTTRLDFLPSHAQSATHCLIPFERPHVPVVKGDAFCAPPAAGADENKKESFALRLLLLFRPWRAVDALLQGGDGASFYSALLAWEPVAGAETSFWIRNALAYFRSEKENPELAFRNETEFDPDVPDPLAKKQGGAVEKIAVASDAISAIDDDDDDTSVPSLSANAQKALTGAYNVGMLPGSLVSNGRPVSPAYQLSNHPALQSWSRHRYSSQAPTNVPALAQQQQANGPVTVMRFGAVARPTVELLRRTTDVDIARVVGRFHLNDKQAKTFSHIARNVARIFSEPKPETEPFRILISGPAGTGKSVIVKAVTAFMTDQGCRASLRIVACWGSAAALVDGETLSHAFGFGTDPAAPPSKETLRRLQTEWKDIWILVIDEVSTWSCNWLYATDRRAKLIKGNNVFMGGLSLILSGDFHQCFPVQATPLFRKPKANASQEIRVGRSLWVEYITESAFLTEVMRQRDGKGLGRITLSLTKQFVHQGGYSVP